MGKGVREADVPLLIFFYLLIFCVATAWKRGKIIRVKVRESGVYLLTF